MIKSAIKEVFNHGKTVITHSLTVGSSRNFERRKEGFWIRLCKGTAKVHEGTDEVLEGTAQEYESTAGANLSTAEVYESTAHSLFKMRVLIIPFSRRFIFLIVRNGGQFEYWKAELEVVLIMCGDMFKDSNSYLKSRGSIEDFVSFREMITSQLQGKLWLYDEVLADFTNLEPVVNVSPIPTSRINSIHPSTLILGDPQSAFQTRSKVTKSSGAHAFVYRNKKDERGIVVRNKARLVAQGHRQEEGINYDEVFAPMARIEAIRIFLAFASYMGFIVYQMDVKSAFLYGKIDEEVYVSQPPGFIDPKYHKKVYKVVKALYGLHQAPRA
ncbi:putative ribonuclease H-like domain-containing protein, partial [Tanacetum coccineum]